MTLVQHLRGHAAAAHGLRLGRPASDHD